MALMAPYTKLIQSNRNFRYLWFSQVVSLFGDWFNLIASAALIAHLSESSGIAISGLFIARLLPSFLLGPIAGVIVDRFNRRTILIWSDVLSGMIVLCILFIRSAEHIWLLYLLTVLQVSLSACYKPATAALIPGIVDKKEVITANTLNSLTWSSMLAFGAAAGGLTTAILGIRSAFMIDALTFFFSAWLTLQVHIPIEIAHPTFQLTTHDETSWQTLQQGFLYLFHQPAITWLALVKASGAISYGGVEIVQVQLATNYFPIGANSSGTLGLIYFVIGLGTGLGPIAARYITGDTSKAMYWGIFISFIFSTVGYLLLIYSSTLLILLIATIFRTIGSSVGWVYSSSLLQISVPDKLLGRIFAFDFAMMTLASSISTISAGWAYDHFNLTPYQISSILGLLSFTITLGWGGYLIYYLRHPQQRPFSAT